MESAVQTEQCAPCKNTSKCDGQSREDVQDCAAGSEQAGDDLAKDVQGAVNEHFSQRPAAQRDSREFKLPPRVKTTTASRKGEKGEKKEIYKVFDAVPFTPSQGVRTPSPNNMAALRWRMYSPFAFGHHPDSPVHTVAQPRPRLSRLRTSSHGGQAPMMAIGHGGTSSDASSYSENSSGTQILSPVHPAHSIPAYSPFMMYPSGPPIPGFMHPQDPGSPMGLRSPMLPGSPMGTPHGVVFPQTPFGPGPHSPFAPFAHSSPFHALPGGFPGYAPIPEGMLPHPRPFPFFGPHPAPSPFAGYPPYLPAAVYPPPHAPGLEMQPGSACATDVMLPGMPPLARQMSTPLPHSAAMMPAAQPPANFHASPTPAARPSLRVTQSADLDAAPAKVAGQTRSRFKARKNSEPKIGPDGMPRLNARQRRTLRRAKERALKGLLEVSQALLEKAGGDTSALPNMSLHACETAGAKGVLCATEVHVSADDDGSVSASCSTGTESPCLSRANSASGGAVGGPDTYTAATAGTDDGTVSDGGSDDGQNDPIDMSGIADLIQQLSLKKEEGLVDEKLLRDLQIIQSLIGALKAPAPNTPGSKGGVGNTGSNGASGSGVTLGVMNEHRSALEREVGKVKRAFGFGQPGGV